MTSQELIQDHEDDEIISLADLYDIQTRELSQTEISGMEEQAYLAQRQQAVEGRMLWYEIRANYPKGRTILTCFYGIDNPIDPNDRESLDELTTDLPPGAVIELHLFTGESAQRKIDELNFYGSFFDETGTVAIGPAIPLDEPPVTDSLDYESFVTHWTKN